MDTIFKQIQDVASARLPRGALDGAANPWRGERRQGGSNNESTGIVDAEEIAAPNVTVENTPRELYTALQDVHSQYVSCRRQLQQSRQAESKVRMEKNALEMELRQLSENSRRIISQERRTVQLLRDAIFTTPASKSLVLTRPATAAAGVGGTQADRKGNGMDAGGMVGSARAGEKSSGISKQNAARDKRKKGGNKDDFEDDDDDDDFEDDEDLDSEFAEDNVNEDDDFNQDGGADVVVRTALEQRIDHAYLSSLEEQIETLRRKLSEAQNERDSLQLQMEVDREERAARKERSSSADHGENSLAKGDSMQDILSDLKNAQTNISTLQRRLTLAEEQSRTAAKESDVASELLAQCVQQHKIEKEEWETMKSGDAQLSYMESLEAELTEYRKRVAKMKDGIQRLRNAQWQPGTYISRDHHHTAHSGVQPAAASVPTSSSVAIGNVRTEKDTQDGKNASDPASISEELNHNEVDGSGAETPPRSTALQPSGPNYASSPEEVRYMRQIIAEKDEDIIHLRQKLSESEQEIENRDDAFEALYKEMCDLREALAAAHQRDHDYASRENDTQVKQTVAEERLRTARAHAADLEEALRMSQLKYSTDVGACNETIRQLRAQLRQMTEDAGGDKLSPKADGNVQVYIAQQQQQQSGAPAVRRDVNGTQSGVELSGPDGTGGSVALAKIAGARVKQFIHTATANGRALLDRGNAQRTFVERVNSFGRTSEGRLRLLIIGVIVLVLVITFWQSITLLKISKGEPEPVVDERMLDKCKQWISDHAKRKLGNTV